MIFSQRASDIEPFRVMAILAQARQLEAAGHDIIHLEVGEPDWTTPAPVIEAGIAALRAGQTHYTPALGLPALRAAIATYYGERYQVDVPASRVAVTAGASGALLLAMAALFNPGEEILLADPGYPCNRHFARLFEARAISIPVGPATGYQLTAATVAQHWGPHTRGVLVANPANPTGSLIPAEELAAIHAEVRRRGGWLIVDEIYHELVYEQDPPSAASLGEEVVVISSFSKYFLMTGWRLGWMLMPPAMLPSIDKLAQNIFLAAPTVAQHAALVALAKETRPLLEACKAELRLRRDTLLPELKRLGFAVNTPPQGAFYCYANIDHLGLAHESVASAGGAEHLAERLLLEAGVAITPGSDFGAHQAHRHVRFAYTTSRERILEAMQRIEQVLR
jgi:aspartate/methionine/tyrosine aminotransferase